MADPGYWRKRPEIMPKTLFIHIGHYKTGTTALQVFLQNSTSFLNSADCQYPNVFMHNSKHSAFAFAILRAIGVEKMMYDYRNPTTPKEMWNDLYTYVSQSKVQTTIISSEEFMRVGQFPAAAEVLRSVLKNRPDDLNIKAIAYLRDPASHLRSWHNQLIKMKFPVADMGAAVGGAIEEIHFDYKRAIGPWVDILGAENVMIRPYEYDPENPSALHEDFLQTIGVQQAADLTKVTGDPNPRLDDRVIELVRLMQNLDLPRPTINAIRKQALSYLEAQDALASDGTNQMAEAQEQARAGIDWLSGLPSCDFSVESFAKSLPEPLPQSVVDNNLLLGFVFSEFILLRQRVNSWNVGGMVGQIAELEHKIQALEARK